MKSITAVVSAFLEHRSSRRNLTALFRLLFLLVILPFTFIEFFYSPWMRAQEAARTPRELPEDTRRHVIFTCHDPITMALITTHDDDANISLTIFFRRMRPNVQIISRCTLERNVRTLHRAGADLVLSSASMGANTIFNLLRKSDHLLLAEGVSLFPVQVPHSMQGRRLADCAVRSETGCTIIAVETDGGRVINPDPEMILPYGGQLLLIGTLEAEEKFLEEFRPDLDGKPLWKRWRSRED